MNSAQKAKFVREAFAVIKGRNYASTVSIAAREICDFADFEVLSEFYDVFFAKYAKLQVIYNEDIARETLAFEFRRSGLEIMADDTMRKTERYAHIEPILRAMIVFATGENK